MPDSYRDIVTSYLRLYRRSLGIKATKVAPPRPVRTNPRGALVLLFSPHPDDECLTGGLALRLMREAGARVVNVPVTLGSNEQRRAARWRELKAACRRLSFKLVPPPAKPLLARSGSAITPTRGGIEDVSALLARLRPAAVFCPHARDGHPAHQATNRLVMAALREQNRHFHCLVFQTEYWRPLPSPNLMVELDTETVADLMAALSLHRGEVSRNPYHARLPAWMIDNVRRGAELVGGPGSASPPMTFAALYRVSEWKGRKLRPTRPAHALVPSGQNVAFLLA